MRTNIKGNRKCIPICLRPGAMMNTHPCLEYTFMLLSHLSSTVFRDNILERHKILTAISTWS